MQLPLPVCQVSLAKLWFVYVLIAKPATFSTNAASASCSLTFAVFVNNNVSTG